MSSDASSEENVNHSAPSGVSRWLSSTNHKDIGKLYLVFSGCAGVIAVSLSVIMRMELQSPGVQFLLDAAGNPNAQLFHVLVSAHGLLMM
ncbi:MAG TPA: cytochrome c oxidase subunit I, partial [Xanthobacteraceae bacterium]|nr:cytochrome c oxidase subunit I [Xanthobacteraceae bacterium]